MIIKTARTYRNAFGGLSRSTWLLSWIMLINRSGTMVIPFMTLYLTSHEMGYSVGQAGFVFGLFGAGAFFGAWVGGKLTDRYGFYPVQLITLFGGGIFFLILGQMQSYHLICLFTFLLSFVNEAFRPANSTAIAFYSRDDNRTRSYALNRLAINLGWSVGGVIGGIIAHFDYQLLFWVDGFTNIFAALLMWNFLRPVAYKPHRENIKKEARTKSAWQDKTYMLFIITIIIFASCFFQLFTNMPVFFKNDFHFSEPMIGLLIGINGMVIAVFEMVLVYSLEGKRRRMIYIRTGVTLVGISFLLLLLPGWKTAVALVMILVVSLGEILSMPFSNSYWISRTTPFNRGEYAALYTMAWSVAQTLGPAGAAQLAQWAGFKTLWIAAAALCFLAAWLFNRLDKRELRDSRKNSINI